MYTKNAFYQTHVHRHPIQSTQCTQGHRPPLAHAQQHPTSGIHTRLRPWRELEQYAYFKSWQKPVCLVLRKGRFSFLCKGNLAFLPKGHAGFCQITAEVKARLRLRPTPNCSMKIGVRNRSHQLYENMYWSVCQRPSGQRQPALAHAGQTGPCALGLNICLHHTGEIVLHFLTIYNGISNPVDCCHTITD